MMLTARRRVAATAFGVATAIVLLATIARRFDPLPDGLRAQYFANAAWQGAPAIERVEPPSTGHVTAAARALGGAEFSASWTGWILVPHGGEYSFTVKPEPSASVFVDGRPAGAVDLTSGSHSVLLRSVHRAGATQLEFLWAHDGSPQEPVPSWTLRARRISPTRLVVDRTLTRAAAFAFDAWMVVSLAILAYAFWPEIRVRAPRWRTPSFARDPSWRSVPWVIAGSVVINVIGIWWGLPTVWAGDEMTPVAVVSGMAQRFSHGWWFTYPPFHYYVLAIAYSPMLALHQYVAIDPDRFDLMLTVIARCVTVVMSAVTVLATFLCGRRAFGSRAGLCAAALLPLVAPYIYYSKTANLDVPYLCWFALSLIFYLRLLDGGDARDALCWALFGTMAVCTKDQAFGLYVLMPVAVAYEISRQNAERGVTHPFLRAVVDRRMLVAGATAVLAFVLIHNIIFNSEGFAAHVRNITGPASQNYRAFEPTLAGRLGLLSLTIRLIRVSCGWPLFLTCVAGIVIACANPGLRRRAIWLLVPAVSYYVFALNVILYNYDRFSLPFCLIFVLFGGFAIDRLLAWTVISRPVRATAAAAIVSYTFLYGVTVDVLMVTDSRYYVERWLAARAAPGTPIAVSSFPLYVPRLNRYDATDVYDPARVEEMRPRYFIVNADYTLTEPPQSGLGQILAMLHSAGSNYRLVLRARSPAPWPWLPGGHPDLVGPRKDPFIVSFLRNINPTIEVYERQEPEQSQR